MQKIVKCQRCNQRIEKDDAYYARKCWYCEACYRAKFTHCHDCADEILLLSARKGLHNELFCEVCFSRSFTGCKICGQLIEICNSYYIPGDRRACERCFRDFFACCEGCGDTFAREDLYRSSNGWHCPRCRRFDEWDETPYHCTNPTYNLIGSTRKYGIELETSSCRDWAALHNETYFGCKPDYSIEGREFISPVFYGDGSFNEIATFCKEANSRGWQTNRYCGYHLHLDVSSECWESLRSIAYAYLLTYKLWCKFVSNDRVMNNFCGEPDYSWVAITKINGNIDWEYFAGKRDRFDFINWRSYFTHGSVEIRNHDATLDAETICNWISVHARFIDAASHMNISEIAEKFSGTVFSQFEAFVNIMGRKLSSYYAEQAANLGKGNFVALLDFCQDRDIITMHERVTNQQLAQ